MELMESGGEELSCFTATAAAQSGKKGSETIQESMVAVLLEFVQIFFLGYNTDCSQYYRRDLNTNCVHVCCWCAWVNTGYYSGFNKGLTQLEFSGRSIYLSKSTNTSM